MLTLTSNPEGPSVQHAVLDGATVAASVVAGVARDNATAAASGRLGSVGMVVGATVGSAVTDLGLDLAGAAGPLLAPGLGAQGGTPAALRETFGAALPQVLGTSSREVLVAGPDVGALRECRATRRRATWPRPWRAERTLPTCADLATLVGRRGEGIAIESTPYSRVLRSQHPHVDEGLLLWLFRRSPQNNGPPPWKRPLPLDASAPRSSTA